MQKLSDIPNVSTTHTSGGQKDESFNFSFAECSILLFVPREKWKEDSSVKNCFNCNSQFLFFLRRKHHCRKCGNIFCDNCSNNFLNTEEIGMKHPEKVVRLCDYCFKGTQNYINLMRREQFLHNKSLFQRSQTTPLEEESLTSDSIEEELPQTQSQISENNLQSIDEEKRRLLTEKLKEVVEIMSNKLPIFQDEQFKEKLLKVLGQALTSVYLDSINRNDFMDICHYIKIKKLTEKTCEKPDLRYIQGIICRKNVSDRKMKSSLDNPTILLISPSIDLPTLSEKKENDGPVSMEILLQNERKMMKKIVEVLMKFKPNAIFIENSINRIAADLLKSQGVTIFLKVKGQVLRRIARLTKGKILKSLRNLDKTTSLKNITGTCGRLFTKRSYIPETEAPKDPTLLYIEGCGSEYGGTIELTGEKIEELVGLKKALKILLRLGRHIVLEYEVVSLENKMKEELRKCFPEEATSEFMGLESSNDFSTKRAAIGNFSMLNQEFQGLDSNNALPLPVTGDPCAKEGDLGLFLDQKIGMVRFVKRDFIQYTKIHLVNAIIENYIDITTNPAALAEINSRNKKLLELCGQPSSNKICYYSQDDISLGTFILNKVKHLFTKCEREGCNRPRNNHISLYFQSNRVVRISVEITGFIRAAALNSDGKYVILEENKSPIDRLSSSNSGKFENFSTNRPDIGLSSFKTYIACESCSCKLTEDKGLDRGYLEYSFTRFLSHFFVSSGRKPKNLDNLGEFSPDSMKKCPHGIRKRVFQYGEFMISFTTGSLRSFRLEFHRLSNKGSLNALQEASDRVLGLKREHYLQTFKPLVKNLINEIKELLKNIEYAEYLNNRGILEEFLSRIQMFALSVETSLSANFDCYLDLEFQRLKLAHQFSSFLDVFTAIYNKRTEFPNKLKEFLKFEPEETQEIIEKNKTIVKGGNFSPRLRPVHPCFKRSLSSGKDFESNLLAYEFPRAETKKDLRFSSNSRVREKDPCEKLGFIKKFSRFSEKNLEKQENIKQDESASENDDIIDETQENQFELSETELKLETSPIDDHEVDYSPQMVIETSDNAMGGSGKKEKSSIDEAFKEAKELTLGLETRFFELMTSHEKGIVEVSRLQKYKYVPIYENEPISAVAHAMNSLNYLKEVYIAGGFQKHEQEIASLRISRETTAGFKSFIRTYLEKTKKLEVPSHFVYKTSIVKPFLLNSELRKSISEENPTSNQAKPMEESPGVRKKKLINVSIIVYYAKQFEALRMDNGILLSSFLRSMGCSAQWMENTGGKSKASFIKSFDNLYIFKELEKKEFSMFFNYANSYFDYLWKCNNKKKPSVLTKIYGFFEVKVKSSRYYYVAMENLFSGLENQATELEIYDLKGSDTNRYVERKKKGQTLLDTNFKIDQNGQPLALKLVDKKFVDIAFENDTRFLKKHDLVDYSLLAILDRERGIIRMGIIDYLREYTWDKKVETVAKKISKGGATPTIVSPEEYRERFKKAMNRYFMEIHG